MDAETAIQAVLSCIGFGALGTAIGWTFGYRNGRADGLNEAATAATVQRAIAAVASSSPVDMAAEERAEMARAMNMPDAMVEAMRHAPSLFEHARRAEALRMDIQCECDGCSEATMLRCNACGRRYCMQHLDETVHQCMSRSDAE